MKRIIAAGVTVLAVLSTASTMAAAQADPVSAAGKSIVINEAVTSGYGGPQDEYVEFQNVTDAEIDLGGYYLRFTPRLGRPEHFVDFVEGASVAAGELFLYMGADYYGPWCGGPVGAFDIPDSGTISLHQPNGALVASIVVPQNPPPPLTPCS